MPQYSLRTLFIFTAVSGPLLALLYLRPMAVVYGLIAAPTIAAVFVTAVMTPVLGGLALMHLIRRFRVK
jgi:hypothetical protein